MFNSITFCSTVRGVSSLMMIFD